MNAVAESKYAVQDYCRVGNVDNQSSETKACQQTSWSSLVPDPKSDLSFLPQV